MRKSHLRAAALLAAIAFAVGFSGCIAETIVPPKLLIGEICENAIECAADHAICAPEGDSHDRCWSHACREHAECGPRAHCLIPPEEFVGTCYGLCDTAEDCPEGSSNSRWYCDPLADGEQGQLYCILEPDPFCGNTTVERGEECDDGNFVDEDGCTAECQTEVGCGNGRLDLNIDDQGYTWEEECDDDNVLDGDGCSSECLIEGEGPECGNGILERDEGCDPPDGIICLDTCERADGCGDGTVQSNELCDDGNNMSGDGCSADCQTEFTCGDTICEESSYETCEKCPPDCCPECGNGELDEGEECDDGNNTGSDGCSQGCLDEDGVATCGNNIWEAGEECEDGNTSPEDGCAADCTLEFVCGDALCDTDNYETCRLCPQDCCPQCGNGIREVQHGEQCDTNDLNDKTCLDFCYDGGTLVCTDWCEFDLSQCTGTGPICGDGTAECDEQCDLNDLKGNNCNSIGYDGGTLGCDGNCNFDVSNCGALLWYLHEDFEGSTVAAWTFNGQWAAGEPFGAGEPAAHGGVNCAATVIGGMHGDNQVNDTCSLVSPDINLSAATQPVLRFYQWVQIETCCDGGTVWVSTDGGGTWTYLDNSVMEPDYYDAPWCSGNMAYTGYISSMGWHMVTADLSAYAGQTIKVRFSFCSDGSVTNLGWYIDDILVTEAGMIPVSHETPANLGSAVVAHAYQKQLLASGGSGNFEWTVQGGVNHGWLNLNLNTGELTGTPQMGDLGPGEITVRITETTMPNNYADRTYTFEVVEPAVPPVTWDFDTAQPPSWYFAGDFEWGSPTVVGPSACHGGSAGCVGTTMDGNYSDFYTDRETCYLMSPPVDLTGVNVPTLVYYQYVETEEWSDGGNLWISSDYGQTWNFLDNPVVEPDYNTIDWMGQANFGGMLGTMGWHQVTADLSAYTGQVVFIRFSFYSNDWTNMAGWYIDDVSVVPGNQIPVFIDSPATLPPAVVNQNYQYALQASGGTGTYIWTIQSGTNHGWLTLDPATGVLSGMPGSANLGAVNLTVRAAESTDPTNNYDEVAFNLDVIQAIFFESFDSGQPANWTFGTSWEHGSPTVVGPAACYGGTTGCAGTNMAADYNNNCTRTTCVLITPSMDFSGATAPTMFFQHYIDSEQGWDGGNLYVSTNGGTNWTYLDNAAVDPDYYDMAADGMMNYGGYHSALGWHPVTVDLSAYAGQASVMIRFSVYSDSIITGPGWYVDNVMVAD